MTFKTSSKLPKRGRVSWTSNCDSDPHTLLSQLIIFAYTVWQKCYGITQAQRTQTLSPAQNCHGECLAQHIEWQLLGDRLIPLRASILCKQTDPLHILSLSFNCLQWFQHFFLFFFFPRTKKIRSVTLARVIYFS